MSCGLERILRELLSAFSRRLADAYVLAPPRGGSLRDRDGYDENTLAIVSIALRERAQNTFL